MKTSDPVRSRARSIVRLLAKAYPDAQCALHHENALQLLIATILSAQCTDVRVNMVTPALFKKFRDAKDFAKADPRELEAAIQSTGFFRNKSRNIIACCQQLMSEHGGDVPGTIEELVHLPGVGRKTANVDPRQRLRSARHHRGYARRPFEPAHGSHLGERPGENRAGPDAR